MTVERSGMAGVATASKSSCAVLHDFLLVSGGAEKLVDVLATAFVSPLVVGFANPGTGTFVSGHDRRLHALGPVRDARLARYLVNVHRFSHIDPTWLDQDAVIYSGVIAPMAVHRQTRGRKICYCHSPPRFLYDLKPYYLGKTGWLGRLGLGLLDFWLRPRYEHAMRAMDVVVANSENVRLRLKRYLGIDAVVIHPPIDVDCFRWVESGDFFLSVARLEDFKRVGLIIEAFKHMPDQKLVVASGGGQEGFLRNMAKGCANITFTSWLAEEALADLVGGCRAVIYVPIDEDFGMSPVEAMAAGKPVIGVAEGGLLETVVDGETGVLLPPDFQTEDLVDALRGMSNKRAKAMRTHCEARARLFSREVFISKMRELCLHPE